MKVAELLESTRRGAQSKLSEAKELALERHLLQDELANLARDLQEGEDGAGKTLYQDLDTFHRNLKELESVKAYVGLIRHALVLRCVSFNLLHSPLDTTEMTGDKANLW